MAFRKSICTLRAHARQYLRGNERAAKFVCIYAVDERWNRCYMRNSIGTSLVDVNFNVRVSFFLLLC